MPRRDPHRFRPAHRYRPRPLMTAPSKSGTNINIYVYIYMRGIHLQNREMISTT